MPTSVIPERVTVTPAGRLETANKRRTLLSAIAGEEVAALNIKSVGLTIPERGNSMVICPFTPSAAATITVRVAINFFIRQINKILLLTDGELNHQTQLRKDCLATSASAGPKMETSDNRPVGSVKEKLKILGVVGNRG